MGHYGRLGASLKEVARDTGYPLRTVQRQVRRLLEIEEVFEPSRGRYVLASVHFDLTTDPTARLGFQNLRFTVSNWRETPVPPCRTARAWRTRNEGNAGAVEFTELAWEGRSVKLVWRPGSDTLEGIVAAHEPIPLDRADNLYGWLAAMLGLGQGETTEVTFIEVNSDHKAFRLEPTYLELRDLPNVRRVLYQRAEALRYELRLSKPPEEEGKPLTLVRALEILTVGSALARMERVLDKEIELARLTSETAPGAPRRTAPKSPSEARDAGYG